jgi:hypothetical protein
MKICWSKQNKLSWKYIYFMIFEINDYIFLPHWYPKAKNGADYKREDLLFYCWWVYSWWAYYQTPSICWWVSILIMSILSDPLYFWEVKLNIAVRKLLPPVQNICLKMHISISILARRFAHSHKYIGLEGVSKSYLRNSCSVRSPYLWIHSYG